MNDMPLGLSVSQGVSQVHRRRCKYVARLATVKVPPSHGHPRTPINPTQPPGGALHRALLPSLSLERCFLLCRYNGAPAALARVGIDGHRWRYVRLSGVCSLCGRGPRMHVPLLSSVADGPFPPWLPDSATRRVWPTGATQVCQPVRRRSTTSSHARRSGCRCCWPPARSRRRHPRPHPRA